MGTQPPPQKGGGASSPIFGLFLLWPNGWMHQDATWYGDRPQPRGLCVRGGPSPSPKRERNSQFSFHIYCRQTAGWIKMALGTEVGLSQATFVLDGDPAPFPKRGRTPSPISGPFLMRPNGWMHQDATWYEGRPRPRGLCVRWGLSRLPKKGAETPQFSAHVYCGQTAAWIKMPLGMEVGLGPDDTVLDGVPVPHPQKGGGAPPQFRAHVHCGHTAGWIKMALSMEVGLGPCHIVLDGGQIPLPKRGA